LQAQLRDAIVSAAKGRFIRFEATHPASDGTLHVVDFSIKPVEDETGTVTLLLPEGRDITERKRFEEALRESEEKYRSLIDLSPDPIFIFQDDRYRIVSSAFTKLLGYTQQDVDDGLDALEIVHEDYRESVQKRIQDRLAGKELSQTLRIDMIAKDGKVIPFESSGVMIHYSGRPAVLTIIRDMTERKKIEEKMVIFQKFAEASEQGLGMADLKGNITYINPALCRLLGEEKPEDAVGKDIRLFYPEESLNKLDNESVPMLVEKGHWTGELDFLSIHGKITHTIQSIFIIRDDTGKPFCVANVITDITEHKQLDKILIHREKLKTLGAISAEVAHEIRNPLTSLGGFAQRLKTKYPDSYECDIIIQETRRLENILSRIRNYLEPVDIYPKECSINDIITSCVNLLSPETEFREVTCVLDLDKELPTAYADPGILAQIIINLIRNATEAAAKGGTLFIRSFESGQDLCIEFKNRSSGLAQDDPETIFMPFSEGGKSVGLPLCYRLLKDMGGLLSYDYSQNFMVFTVSLPKTVLSTHEKNS
jgi:PAS domain S-box-containing protein